MDRLNYSPIEYDVEFRSLMNKFMIDSSWIVKVNVYRCRHPKFIQAWRLFKCNPDFQSYLVRWNHPFSSQAYCQTWFDDYCFMRFRV